MKIAIFGVGFLGSKLINFLSNKYEIFGVDISLKNKFIINIDATNPKKVLDILLLEKPDVVINTIALSSYVTCEKKPELCKKLNFYTAVNIIEACKIINAKLIFMSSSYVFDGESGNYCETDIPNARHEYGRLKIQAEKKVLELNGSIVIRTETLYGYEDESGQAIVGSSPFNKEIKVGYPNIIRCPVFVDDIPRIIYQLLVKEQSGIFHIAGPKKHKYLDFLNQLASAFNLKDTIFTVDSSNWILRPPYDTSLDVSKLNSLGISTTSLSDALYIVRKMATTQSN